jgi:hypothetical protein
MKQIRILLLSLFFFAACDDKGLREGVLEEQKMINVLTDLTIIDGYMSALMYTDSVRVGGKNYYATIYRKHGISKAVFDKSMKYYSTQPARLDSMYSKVTRKLETQEKKLNKINELEQRKATLAK